MDKRMTEIELVNHYKGLDVREHIEELILNETESYSFPEMQVEMFMTVFEKSSLKPEVYNVLLDFCYSVSGLLVLPNVSNMVNRWESLQISTAYKALLQAKSDNEVLSIFGLQDG
ncbi:hypothetical protein [Sporosarcina koreensis]|uniref:Uncharacterized protein n=1 Tax=Sporosarcina koreensis TaxID=334735 RepID=A0ABW0TVE3_9BACL